LHPQGDAVTDRPQAEKKKKTDHETPEGLRKKSREAMSNAAAWMPEVLDPECAYSIQARKKSRKKSYKRTDFPRRK
jgi:hypothetical protein